MLDGYEVGVVVDGQMDESVRQTWCVEWCIIYCSKMWHIANTSNLARMIWVKCIVSFDIKDFLNCNDVSTLENDITMQGEMVVGKGIKCIYTSHKQSTFIIERGKERLMVLWLAWTRNAT